MACIIMKMLMINLKQIATATTKLNLKKSMNLYLSVLGFIECVKIVSATFICRKIVG